MKLKDLVFAAIGWLDETGRKIEELYEELVERGRLRSEGSDKLLEKLIDKARGERKEAGRIVREIIQDATENAGLVTASDMERIADRLSALDPKTTAGGAPGKKSRAAEPRPRQSGKNRRI